jgi:hypothetical protein
MNRAVRERQNLIFEILFGLNIGSHAPTQADTSPPWQDLHPMRALLKIVKEPA